jgi:hypothetical protein
LAGNSSISLRLAVTGAEESLRTIATFGEAGQQAAQRLVEKFNLAGTALDGIGEHAKKASTALEATGRAAGGLSGQARFAISDVANQVQDFVVQVQGGTSAFKAFAQQFPQAASAFGPYGAVLGAVGSLAAVAVGAVVGLSEASKASAEEAKKQASSFDDLAGKFGLSTKGADDLVESYGRMTAAQQGLISANLSAVIDGQTASLKELKKQLDATVPSASQAQASPSFFGSIAQGIQAGDYGNAPADAEDPNIELQRRAAQRALDEFEKTGQGADVLRTALQALALARNEDAEAAAKTADEGVAAATAYKLTKDARDLVIAQFAILHGGATQEQRDLVETADAMKAAQTGAKAYADTLADLRERQRVATMSPEDAKAYGLQKKGGLLDLQKAADVEQDPDKKAALQSDIEERRTQLAVEAQATVQAEALAASRKKLADFTQELAAKESGLAQGLDKEAAARAKAEGDARRALTVEGQLAEGGEAAIKRKGNDAAAEVRRAEALQAGQQAEKANAKALLDHNESLKVVAAGTDKLAQARAQGERAARDSGVTDQNLIRLRGEDAVALERQREATQAKTKVDSDAVRQAEALRKVSEELDQARAIASLPVQDVAASRDQKEAIEAQVEAVKAGFKVGTDQFNQYVAQREEILRINDALKAQNTIAQIRADLQEKIKQGEYYGYTSEGRPILRDGEDFKTERTITVNDDRLNGGRYTNIPTIYNGKQYDDAGATDMAAKFAAFGTVYKGFDSLNEALDTAKQRTHDLGPEVDDLAEAFKRQAFIEQNVNDKLKGMTEADLAAQGGIDVVTASLDKQAAAAFKVAEAHEARRAGALVDEKDNADLQRQTELLEALGQNLQAYYDKKAQLETQDALKAKGITPGTLAGPDPTDEQKTAAQREYDERVARGQAAKLANDEVDARVAALNARNKDIADALTKPFEEIPHAFGKAFEDVFQQLQETGKVDGAAIGKSFAQGIQTIGFQGVEGSIQALIKPMADKFSSDFATALNQGQNPFQAFTTASGPAGSAQAGFAGASMGSEIGAIGGTAATGITGNPNAGLGASVGGTAGGAIGNMILPGIGGIIGSMLGSAAGGFIGSLFGGDSAPKDRAHLSYVSRAYYDPYGYYDDNGEIKGKGGIFGTGVVYQDDSASAQNRERIRQVSTAFNSVDDLLAAVGIESHGGAINLAADNKGGIQVDGQKFSSADDVVHYYIDKLLHGDKSVLTYNRPLTDTQKTILENTRASNAQELQADLNFAQTYDTLSGKQGQYGAQLAQLAQTYAEASLKATRLGLDTQALADTEAKAEARLRAQTLIGIRQLEGVSGPAAQALFELGAKFDDAEKDIAALGISEQELGDARAKQTAKLREQYHYQAEALIDAFGPLGQTILRIRQNFDQARQIFTDLGESVEGLAEKQAAAEHKAYADAQKQLQQQLSGQSQSIRSFLDGLVNPLKQALSGLGPLAGYVAPQQALSGGISQIRQDFKLASNDNVAAIQAFPQEAQQFLQLARQNLGSGPQFAAFFNEIQRDLQSLYATQKDRADQIEATLPSTEQTAQQQLDVLQSGFQDTVDALNQLHDDWLSLNPGLAGAANVNVAVDPAQMATAFAPQLAAQQQGNQLIASVSDAVRLGTAAQTDAVGRMTNVLADRLDRLERTIRLLQPGRLGNAA